MQPNHSSQSIALPIAIIVGFCIIAATLFFANSKPNTPTGNPSANLDNTDFTPIPFEDLATRLHRPIQTVTSDDHIRGNPNAPVMLVVYTSFECPSCRTYHLSLHRLLREFGQNGDLAWTFRNLPLSEQYPNGVLVANAAECVAELNGNQSFWDFTDELFSTRGPVEPVQLSRLSEHALNAGVSEADFNRCMNEERHYERIIAQADDATAAGSFAIPYTVVLTESEVGVINGSVPYADLKQIIDVALASSQQ